MRARWLWVGMSIVPLLGSVSCGGSDDDDSTSSMPRKVSSSVDRPIHLVGQKAKVFVKDERVGPEQCREAQGCQGPHTVCSRDREPVDSEVESVTCTEPGCTARVTSHSMGSVTIEVESTHETIAEVVVTLRDSNGERLETHVTVDWVAAAEIDVRRHFSQAPHGSTYASLVGSEHRWCAEVKAPKELYEQAQDALVVSTTGALDLVKVEQRFMFDKTTCFRFAAREKGAGEVRLASGGVERRFPIEVVEEADVTSVELLVFPKRPSTELFDVEKDFLTDATSSDTIALPECDSFGSGSYVVPRLGLTNGKQALGGAESLVSGSDALEVELAPTWKTGSIAIATGREPGETTLSFSLGTVSKTVPVAIGGACPRD